MVIFARHVTGASHVRNDLPCQDYSLCGKHDDYYMIAVSDGHGGKRHFRSDVGSRFAVASAKKCIFYAKSKLIKTLEKAVNDEEVESTISQLKQSIVREWNRRVEEDLNKKPLAEDELANIPGKYAKEYRNGSGLEAIYGATLITALLTDKFLLVLQIGDGHCVTVGIDGNFKQPVPTCDKCVFNETTSLCNEDAITNFRHYIKEPPPAVFIGTDGIDNTFAGNEKLFVAFYKVVLQNFSEKDEETAKAELIDYLPRMSEKGSGDDISLGMIADIEKLKPLFTQQEPIEANENEASAK